MAIIAPNVGQALNSAQRSMIISFECACSPNVSKVSHYSKRLHGKVYACHVQPGIDMNIKRETVFSIGNVVLPQPKLEAAFRQTL